MKTSEVIKKLQELKKQFGDLEVILCNPEEPDRIYIIPDEWSISDHPEGEKPPIDFIIWGKENKNWY